MPKKKSEEPQEPQTPSKREHLIETLRNARRGCVLNPADIDMLLEYIEAN